MEPNAWILMLIMQAEQVAGVVFFILYLFFVFVILVHWAYVSGRPNGLEKEISCTVNYKKKT